MAELILEALRKSRPQVAAVSDGKLRLNYGELRRAVVHEQRWLTASAVRRCALLADNTVRWVISDLALLACGATHVPLPGYFSATQTGHVLDDAAIDAVLTDRPEEFAGQHGGFSLLGTSYRTGLSLLRRHLVARCPPPQGIVKVTYTSGSTGTPKGVCLASDALEAVAGSLATATAGLGIARHLCVLPLATLLENIAGIYVPLLLGAEISLRPLAALGVSYDSVNAPLLCRAIDHVQPDSLVLVPELLRLLVHSRRQGWMPLQPLKFIAVGGASVAVELLHAAQGVGLPVFEGYGLSECASVVCLNTPAASRAGSVGRPLSHARVRIDTNGEICVGGAVMTGYLGEPSMVQAEIRTGDLGEMDADGFLYVRGRAKNMFITSMGRNVTPEWVERELVSEPAIAQAMVVGESRPYPVAFVSTAAAVNAVVIDRAIASANERLPEYARVRRWRQFPEVPSRSNGLLTANGRLRRDAILKRHGMLIASLYDTQEDLTNVVP